MKRLIPFLALLLGIVSCNHPQVIRNNQIKRICFAGGGCYGHCPYLAISMDSSLNYYFEGIKNCDSSHIGIFSGKISQGCWDSLNIKFEQVDYMKLDSNLGSNDDDFQTELIIYTKDKRKRLYCTTMYIPDNLKKIYEWLLNSYKTIHLTKIFDTKIQKLPPLAPPPDKWKVSPPSLNSRI